MARDEERGVGSRLPEGEKAERVLAVAERLFAERGYDKVSVRDIAEQAAVTHPLIYYYWGSKRGLLAAVLERSQSRMRTTAYRQLEARDTVLQLVRENLAGSRTYLITLARAFLDGMPTSDWPGGFPAMEAAVERLLRAGPEGDPAWDEEARLTIAVVAGALVGWILLEDQLLEIVGLSPAKREKGRDHLIVALDAVLERELESAR